MLYTLAHYLAQTDAPVNLWNLAQTGGVVGVLLLGLYLIVSGRLPTKKQLDDMRDEKNFWRSLALNAMNLTEAHIKVSEDEIPERMELHEVRVNQRLAAIEALIRSKGLDREKP